ncbi:hypothetical protein [Xanthomonas indica]|uniref:Uncharacterized protein n=1 Tax=Xanthomonas indica TaxID=2912242 RepID=A0AAU8I2H0_9XANT|nr:hypothetical protein [Xanthomonas indica]MCI2260916.1 hypothetical protein [Xanthomonas indica]
MSRVRWLEAEWGVTLRQLANALKTERFANDSSEGFVIDRIRRDSIEARYIQRIELTEVVMDPFGKESSYQRLSFNEQAFIVSNMNPGLELKNGSRSLQPFFSLLSQVTDFKFAVKSISVDVDAWMAAFMKKSPSKLTPDAVQVGGIAFHDGATARAIVKSGRGDASAAAKEIVAGKPYVVEKVRLRPKPGTKGTILLSSNCAATVTGFSIHEESVLLEVLRETLRRAIE